MRRLPLAPPTIALLSLLLAGCGVETSSNTRSRPFPAEVDRLAEWLSGSFSSIEQAASDPEFLEISLGACRVWPSRTDGRWVYVEQAREDALDRPYRQRMYRIRIDDRGVLVSEVFMFPQGSEPAAGSWKDPASLDSVDPFLLVPREGCTVYLDSSDATSFEGGTEGKGCTSSLGGADHATSEVTVSADTISSWDRGFDADGVQVWGSTSGPYVFRRRD